MDEVERLKRRWEREDEGEIDAAVSALLQHSHGKKLLWWLLRIGRFGTQPFTGNALNTAFACGELNIGQQVIERILRVEPEGFVNMMKEQADERRSRDTILDGKRNGDASSGDADFDYGDDNPDG